MMTSQLRLYGPQSALRRTARQLARRILSWWYRGFNPSTREGRTVRVSGLKLSIGRGVFDPSLHFTSGYLAAYMKKHTHFGPNDRVLDVGTGSGVLAITAALSGCTHVVAVDINPEAIASARHNARRYDVSAMIEIQEGEFVPRQMSAAFNHVACNPPYFRGKASNIAERAYLAGADLEWFDDFLRHIEPVLAPDGRVFMVLSDAADLASILGCFREAGWVYRVVARRDILIEIMYVLELTPQQATNRGQ